MREYLNFRRNSVSTDEEWKSLYQFQANFRSQNKVTASDLLMNLELPLSLLQYLYSDSVRPSNKIGTLEKSLRENLRILKEKGRCGFISGQNPEFILREIYELNKDELRSYGVDIMRLGDDNSVIIDNTPSFGTTFDQHGEQAVKNVLKGTQFEDSPIVIETYTLLSVLESPICTRTDAGYGTSTMVLYELGVFGITAKHTIITSEQYKKLVKEDTNICVRALQRTPLTCRYPISSPTDVVVGYANYENLHKELDIATFLPLAHNSFPVNMFNASVPYIMNKEMLTKFEYVKDVKVCLHMYVLYVCMIMRYLNFSSVFV